jgi:ribosomal subunit interface protein
MPGNDAITRYAHDKLSTLEKFFRSKVTAEVMFSLEERVHIIDVTITAGNAHIHSTDRNDDVYQLIDIVHQKLERQIRLLRPDR